MKYLILFLSFNCFAQYDLLVEDEKGEQHYLENVYDYDGKILYKGKLNDAQKGAIGALDVSNSGIFIDHNKLELLKAKKKERQDAEKKKKKDKNDALERLKSSSNQDIKDLLEVLDVR